MGDARTFYNRYWKDEHVKINSFDDHPGEWTEENFNYHLDFFKPFVKGKLLDFGCGDGQFLHRMSRYCESTYGVDVSEVVIEKSSKNYAGIKFSLISEEGKMDFPDNFFDTVCAIDVLEHILDLETVLGEIHRVLKPDGNLLIATNEITRLKMILITLRSLDNYFYPTSPHIRYFTRKNLSHLLERIGLKTIEYKKNRTYFGFIPQGQMVVAVKK